MGSGGVEGLSSRFYRLAKRAKSAFLWPESSLIVSLYDEAGNILRITTIDDLGVSEDVRDDAGWSSGDRINTLNQIMRQDVGGDTWTFSYDLNGNMTGKTNGVDTWTYTWNDENRLVRVQGPGSVDVAYSYDLAGRMMTRDDGTVTTFTWDDFSCVREQTGMSTTTYCIPEGVLRSFIRDGDRYDCHTDALGSVRLVTDDNGDVIARLEHSAFGSQLASSDDNVPGGLPYGFVGSLGVRFDSVTGLHYMRARWYDPTLGRFISKDPIGLAGGINRYCYAANNPTRYADPFGLKICFSGDPELIKMYIDYMETVGIPFKNKQKLKDKIKDGCLCFDESEIDLKKVKSGKLPQTLVDILTHSDPIRFKLVANDNGVTLGANEIGQQTLDLGDFARLDQTQGIPDAVKLNLMTHELGEAIISQTEGVGWGTSHPPAVSDYENTGIRSSGGDWQRGGNLNRLQYQDGQGNHYEIMPMDPSPQFPAGRFQVTPRWLP